MDHINILHLSDIHFKRKVTDTFRSDIKQRMLEAIRSHIEKESNCIPNFVVVTGDISFSGKKEEYDEAEFFLNEIRAILPGSAEFLIVQGNHDVDRDKLDCFANLYSIVKNNKQVDEFLEHPYQIKHKIIPKFQEFRNFVKRMNPDLYKREEDFFWVKNFEESNISFLGLNSCWACEGDQDKDNITLGYPQVSEALKQSKHPNKILLMHHPTENWFNEGDFKRYCDEIYKNCSLILHGHTHYDLARVIQSPSYSYIVLAANASYTKYEDGFLGFQFIQAVFKKKGTEVRVWPYRSELRGRVRFVPDTNRYDSQEGSFFVLSTVQLINTPFPVSPEVKPKSPPLGLAPLRFSEAPLPVRFVPDPHKIDSRPWLQRYWFRCLLFLISVVIFYFWAVYIFPQAILSTEPLQDGNLTGIDIGYIAPSYAFLFDEIEVPVTVLNTSKDSFTGTVTLAFSQDVFINMVLGPYGKSSFTVENLIPKERDTQFIKFKLAKAPPDGTFEFQFIATTPDGRTGTTKWQPVKLAPFPFFHPLFKYLVGISLMAAFIIIFLESSKRFLFPE
jgi:calcineurin-like phosphoesterase family protein